MTNQVKPYAVAVIPASALYREVMNDRLRDKTTAAIQYASEHDIEIAFASLFPIDHSYKLFSELGLKHYWIIANGGVLHKVDEDGITPHRKKKIFDNHKLRLLYNDIAGVDSALGPKGSYQFIVYSTSRLPDERDRTIPYKVRAFATESVRGDQEYDALIKDRRFVEQKGGRFVRDVKAMPQQQVVQMVFYGSDSTLRTLAGYLKDSNLIRGSKKAHIVAAPDPEKPNDGLARVFVSAGDGANGLDYLAQAVKSPRLFAPRSVAFGSLDSHIATMQRADFAYALDGSTDDVLKFVIGREKNGNSDGRSGSTIADGIYNIVLRETGAKVLRIPWVGAWELRPIRPARRLRASVLKELSGSVGSLLL